MLSPKGSRNCFIKIKEVDISIVFEYIFFSFTVDFAGLVLYAACSFFIFGNIVGKEKYITALFLFNKIIGQEAYAKNIFPLKVLVKPLFLLGNSAKDYYTSRVFL